MQKVVLARYGELSLKGRNRYKFEDRLMKNVRLALSDLPPREIKKTYGRIYIGIADDQQQVLERLQKVFGFVSFSPAVVVPLDLEVIKQTALKVFGETDGGSFKVETKRPNKKFPLKSPEVSREVGGYLLEHTGGRRVDVHRPDVLLEIEIREEGAFVYCRKVPGMGGLPLGSTGKGILLLSGGIDSPVAGWMGMKRGVELTALHFHSFPFTSERAREKVIDLCRVLTRYCGSIKLHVNYFTEIQKAVRKHCPPEYYVTIMRRMMFRIAREIARREEALAIFTGESLGQVASQTLESMTAIGEVTDIPILRPLVAMDKQEIIEIAQKIDTYEISIRPYEDCCTLFVPKHPSTRPKVAAVRRAEASLDIGALLEESLAKSEVLLITPQGIREQFN